MRVLHVVPAYEPAWAAGGVVRCLSILSRALTDLGLQISVYTTNYDGKGGKLDVPVSVPLNVSGVEVTYFKPTIILGREGWDSRELSTTLYRTVRQFDLVYVAAIWQWIGVSASSAAHQAGVPFIIGTHGSFSRHLLRRGWLKKVIYYKTILQHIPSWASALHFTTEFERQEASAWTRGICSFVVPNPVSGHRFQRSRELAYEFRRALNIPLESTVILSVGRLDDPKKRSDLMIQAVALLAGRYRDVKLVLVGPGRSTTFTTIENWASTAGIRDKLIMTGLLEGDLLQGAYSASDVFLLLSEDENFGMVVVEAMLAGLPVVVSQQVGIAGDVIADGAGLQVELNAERASRALKAVLSDRDRLKCMGECAIRSAQKRYDPHRVADLMRRAYEDVVTKPAQPHTECQWNNWRGNAPQGW